MDLIELLSFIDQQLSENKEVIEFSDMYVKFHDKIASNQYERILRNEIKPYEFYENQSNSRTAISLEGIKNIIIDGKGAIIHVSGMLIPFYLENCENIILQNFTIQYDTLTHSEGVVVRRGLSSFDVHLSNDININNSVPIMAWIEYDAKTRLLGRKEAYANTRGEILDKNTIRVPISPKFQRQVPKKGQGIILRHIITHHSGIQLFNCNNITIRNVEVNEAYWGALLAHRVKNLTIDDLRVIPRVGNIFSTNADACHLISCSGKVEFSNSLFEGHGDDALNVHTLYFSIKKILNSHELTAYIKIQQQDRVMDYPDQGDIIEFTRLKILKSYSTNRIQSVRIDEEQKLHHIILEDPIPKDIQKNDVLANVSKAAQVNFIKNKIHNNRARGILIQSRDVLIENNEFSNCTGTGIYITCSKYWWEALSSENVQIINNLIHDCGGGPGTMGASGITISTEARQEYGTHKNILIKGNTIQSSKKHLPDMKLQSIERLILQDNNTTQKIAIKKCSMIKK